MELEQVLRGVLPPLAVALLLLLPRARRAAEGGAPGDVGPAGALGLGLGAAVGVTLLLGGLGSVLDPVTVQQKLAWIALAAGVIGAVDLLLGTRTAGRVALRTVLRFALPAAVLWWLLAFLRRSAWTASEAWAWVSALAAAIAALGTAIDWLAGRRPGASYACALCAAAAVAAGALVAGRSASYGQFAGALAAALGAAVVIGLVNPGFTARGAGMPVAMLLGALVLAGHLTAELARSTALAVFLAPLAPVVVEALPLRERPRVAAVLRVVAAMAPGVVMGWVTYSAPVVGY